MEDYGNYGNYDYEDAMDGPFRTRRREKAHPVCHRCGAICQWVLDGTHWVLMNFNPRAVHNCGSACPDDFPLAP